MTSREQPQPPSRRRTRFSELEARAHRIPPAPRADLFDFWWSPEFVFDDTRVADLELRHEFIQSTSFIRSELTNIFLDSCALRGVVFEDAVLERCTMHLAGDADQRSERVALHGAELNEVELRIARGTEVYFTNCTITFSDLAGDIATAGFTDAVISDSRVQFDFNPTSDLPSAGRLPDSEVVRFDGASVRNSGLYLRGPAITFDLATLTNVDMERRGDSGSTSRGFSAWETSWIHATLNHVNLEAANLQYADFSNATLTNVNFNDAGPWLVDAYELDHLWNFSNAQLHSVSFRGAGLRRANFTGAELVDVDLHGADLSDALIYPHQLLECRNWEHAIMDPSLRIAVTALAARRTPPGPEPHTLA